MAKTGSITVADELKNLQRNALEQSDRFLLSVVQGHKSLPSDARRKAIKEQSLFKFLSPLWRALTPTEKSLWKTAAGFSGINGWQLFISDNAARVRSDLPLDVQAVDLWQVRAGHLVIEPPASEILLEQAHPLTYYISQKIAGAPWKNEMVLLQENFSFPLDLEIRYKTDLTATGPEQRARYYAEVWTSYQGQDIKTIYAIDFNPSTDWTLGTLEISRPRGIIVGYTLFLDIYGYTGSVLFDNIRAVHGGTNWALDPRCDAIDKTFKKAFAIVPPFWVPKSAPSGATFQSQYPPAL